MDPDPRRARVRRILEAAGSRDIRPTHEGFVARCPFHDGPNGFHKSKSPSLAINTSTGFFICFSGVCKRSGSLKQVLVDLLGYPFSRAQEMMADFANPVPDLNSIQFLPYERRHEMIQGRDARSMEESLLPSLNPAILGIYDFCPKYMLGRGFRKGTLRRWDIGYDRERRAVTIPVWTREGRLVGLTRRTVLPDVEPRYKHVFFSKRYLLYGEHLVAGVNELHPLIVSEAQLSAIWFHQAGISNPVSTMGSKISTRQIELLSRYPYIVLAFDDDVAGREATQAAIHGWVKVIKSPSGRIREEYVPGLVQRLGPGRIKVLTGWQDHLNKDDHSRLAKDPQEVAEEEIPELLSSAVPWEQWDSSTGRVIPR